MTFRFSLTLAALAPLLATPAFAGTLATPFTFVGTATPYCIITNVDAKAIEVSVSATNFFGSTRTPDSENCPVAPNTLDPGETCYSAYTVSADLACRFTAKGKVRASAQLLDTNDNPIVVVPATAK